MIDGSNDKYTSDRIISELTKIYNLKESELYSIDEYNERKVAILEAVTKTGISQNLDDFLTNILILKEKGILNIDELKQIKVSLSGKVETDKTLTASDVNETNKNMVICKECKTAFDKDFTIINQDGILCPHCEAMNPLDEENKMKYIHHQNIQIPKERKVSNKKKLILGIILIPIVLIIVLIIGLNILVKIFDDPPTQNQTKETNTQQQYKTETNDKIDHEYYDEMYKKSQKDSKDAKLEEERIKREKEWHQYNDPILKKAKEEDLKRQKEADKREMDQLKKRYLDN